ncbi:SLBB domain-containing protein [Nibrella saemangeumensis]|uniref:SLBB domain-containing protein n=1 Tax=Nibrella saemangeumensis TaxID=1084526 RepID=A0ABP8ND84_9BACT
MGLILAGMLSGNTFGQVLPGPATPAPTTLPTQPGNLPRNLPTQSQQPGRGLPGQTTPQGPAGRTPAGQPQPSSTQSAPGQQPQTGRTQQQQSNQTATDPNSPDFERQSQEDQGLKNQQTNEEFMEQSIQAARERERQELRRKLFGYEIFGNPDLRSTFEPNINIATPRNYIVGPGDQLNIRLYGYSEANFTQTVSPEGNIYFADQTGIGPVSVTGLSIEQAKARITDRLARRYVGLKNSSYGAPNTYLELTLGNIRSIRVSVLGEAVKPGTYSISSLSTAMNAIYQSGGPNELGSFRKVQIIRNNKVIATLDLYDLLLLGVQRNDIRLQDNDNIRFQTFEKRVEITGPVKRNKIFEMLPNENLGKLLYFAGGFAANAYKSRIKITRLTERERKVIDVTADQFETFTLQDGDQVTVEQILERYENQVSIEGAVFRPGQYSLDQSKTLKQLITNADGLQGDAFVGRITIVRTREDLAIENITVNYADIINGVREDVPLQREDKVVIPSRFDLAEPATITIIGEVNSPPGSNELPYMANMTLEDLLLRVGGLKESAAASQIEVVRRKKDVDPKSTTAEVAQTFRIPISRDLSINPNQSQFVLEPFDQVIVRRSPNYQVQTFATIEGEVILPGGYPIRSKDQKISDLVNMAGGLTPYAYVEGATLVRQVRLSADEIAQQQRSVSELADDSRRTVVQVDPLAPGKEESIGINLKRILDNPGSPEDMLIQENDILRIPKRLETVRLQGEVLLPTTVKYRPGQTFQDYIAQAGGFTSKSQRKKSFIVYANGSADRTRKFMFFNIYPRVEPGSEIVIPTRTAAPLTPQQILGQATAITSSVMTLITLILAYRTIR